MKKLISILLFFISIAVSAQSYYGTYYGTEGLQNLPVGQNAGQELSYRFKAEKTGNVEKVMLFYVYNTALGYGKGDGGDIVVTLETDNPVTHLPSGVVLATVTDADPMNHVPLDPNYFHVTLTFAAPAAVTAGILYHLHVRNTAADIVNNYISLNTLWVLTGLDADRLPVTDTLDLASQLDLDANPWHFYNTTPVYTLIYDDAVKKGQGYCYAAAYDSHDTINGANFKARSNITVTGSDKIVNKVWVRAKKISGSEDLTIRLETSGGVLIEQGTVAATDINATQTWVALTFSTYRTLTSGSTYHVVLSTGNSTTYCTIGIEDGNGGWGYAEMFPNGHYEYMTDGATFHDILDGSGWIPTTSYKLQSYFEEISPPSAGGTLLKHDGRLMKSGNKLMKH